MQLWYLSAIWLKQFFLIFVSWFFFAVVHLQQNPASGFYMSNKQIICLTRKQLCAFLVTVHWFVRNKLKLTEACSKPCQTCNMKFFAKTVNSWKPNTRQTLHLACLTGFWIRHWSVFAGNLILTQRSLNIGWVDRWNERMSSGY